MKLLRLKSVFVTLVLVLGISSCSQKKPVLVAPQQAPPTTAPQPTPTPEPEATSQPEGQQQETQPPAATTQQTTTAAKNKPKNSKPSTAKKPTSSTGKIVVQPDKPGTPAASTDGQISPGPTAVDTAHNQTSTEQLLHGAEENLNSIKRQLSKDQEAMRAQIKEFINQSHKATTENDLARAHNFAVKARLLSDELVKSQ
jgi:outer membrane biosynthesis protein TonB